MGIGQSLTATAAFEASGGNLHVCKRTPISCVVCSWHHRLLASQSGIFAASDAGGRVRLRHQRPLGEATCNICRDGLCSALIRSVRREDIGSGRISPVRMPGWSSVRAAGVLCKRCRRQLVPGSVWGRVPWPRGHRCDPDLIRFFFSVAP